MAFDNQKITAYSKGTGAKVLVYLEEFHADDDLVGIAKDKVVCKDESGVCFMVDKKEFDSDENLNGNTKGKSLVRDEGGVFRQIPRTEFLKNKEKYKGTFNGKKHSQDSKDKIGVSNSISQKGDKNSQFGSKWINKDGSNKKAPTDQLDKLISQGWSLGRKSAGTFQGVDQDLIDKIVELYNGGIFQKDIAKQLSIGKSSVQKYISQYKKAV